MHPTDDHDSHTRLTFFSEACCSAWSSAFSVAVCSIALASSFVSASDILPNTAASQYGCVQQPGLDDRSGLSVSYDRKRKDR